MFGVVNAADPTVTGLGRVAVVGLVRLTTAPDAGGGLGLGAERPLLVIEDAGPVRVTAACCCCCWSSCNEEKGKDIKKNNEAGFNEAGFR